MQRYLNGLCLACKELNYKIMKFVQFLTHRKRTEKPHSRAPFLPPQCRNHRELQPLQWLWEGPCSIAVSEG